MNRLMSKILISSLISIIFIITILLLISNGYEIYNFIYTDVLNEQWTLFIITIVSIVAEIIYVLIIMLYYFKMKDGTSEVDFYKDENNVYITLIKLTGIILAILIVLILPTSISVKNIRGAYTNILEEKYLSILVNIVIIVGINIFTFYIVRKTHQGYKPIK